jgi:outer membrane protein TolC
MLAALTGRTFTADTRFVKPATATAPVLATEVRRPELDLFDARIGGIEARRAALNSAITPRLGLFASGGYGKPGLDMLSNRFEWWAMVGARVSWNIGGLYTRRNDRRRMATDIRAVEIQREAFLLNTALDVALENSDIARLREQMSTDDRIIALRETVLRSTQAKMEGGTATGSDLARDINALHAARRQRSLHEVELLMAIWNLKFATNN